MGQYIHPTDHQCVPPQEFSQQFIAQWKKLNLDVMLCPMLGPALGIGYPSKLSGRTANEGCASSIPLLWHSVSMKSIPPPPITSQGTASGGKSSALGASVTQTYGVHPGQPPWCIWELRGGFPSCSPGSHPVSWKLVYAERDEGFPCSRLALQAPHFPQWQSATPCSTMPWTSLLVWSLSQW